MVTGGGGVVRQKQEHPWLSDLFASLAMASGIGYLAAAYTVSRRMTRASPGKPPTSPHAHGLAWEPVECRTTDGIRLAGWVVTPAAAKATVVLFHGMRRTRADTLGRTAFLVNAGYRCVAFDHRAHGESTGRKTSFGYYESRDVASAFELVRRRWPDQPTVALGISMGAAAVCFAAKQARFDAVILESLYHDIASAFAQRIGNHYPPWFKRLSQGVIWVTERRLGLRLEQLAPAEHIGDLAPTPVLLLTGNEDRHASPAETERLYQRCRGPRELWLVPRACHQDVFETGGPAYQERVLNFLGRWLPRKSA